MSSQDTEFVIVTKCAKMPTSCWGEYRRVAVIEVVKGTHPKMISDRARGVVRIVKTWERCNVSRHGGGRDAYSKALLAAKELVTKLQEETKTVAA